MDYFDILLAKKLNGGGGGDITVESLSVSENGTYTAPSGKAYSPVNVEVPLPANALFKQTLSNLPYPIATINGADAPLDSLKASIVGVQSGSGDPSPSNVRPISGWTEEVITRCGKNFIPNTGYTQGLLGWNEATTETIIASYNFITSPYIKVNPNTNYAIHTYAGAIVRLYITDKNHNKVYWKGNHPTAGETELLKIPSNGYYVRFSIGIDGQNVEPSDYGTLVYAQLEQGTTATTYEPYNGNTYTITFKDSSDNPITVYDGGIDINGGKLTVTHANIASYNGETINEPWISSEDIYTQGATPTIGAQVVYPLTTPLVYDFTPIALRSNGVTNISVNCGEVTECKYYSETP